MADLNLDDVRGYWRDLAAPAYEEFWYAYQRDADPKNSLLLVYRRLICACLLLNHQADKAASLYGRNKRGNHFMDLVTELDHEMGYKLHACRFFSNDAKHDMARLQEASTRPRDLDHDQPGQFPLLVIHMLSTDGKRLSDMCKLVGEVWKFWISYFDGTGVLSYHPARRQQLAAKEAPDVGTTPLER
jgi:hypothetical protein